MSDSGDVPENMAAGGAPESGRDHPRCRNTTGPASGGAPGSGRDHLRLLGERVAPLTGAHERTLPVLDPLRDLLPGGALQRGWVITTGGDGATSLALAVAAGPSAAGSWTAVVGEEGLGLAAAAEAGVVLERLLMVAAPEPRGAAETTAALVDAVDIVLVGSEVRLGAADHRRLAARLRERGSVLIHLGGDGSHGAGVWPGGARSSSGRASDPQGADVRLQVVSSRWSGLGDGWGLLRARRVSVRAQGRGAAGRPRSVDLLLPGPDGLPVLLGPAARDATAPLRSTDEGSADLGCPGVGGSAVVA
ncbi:MAG: hypothetical protein OXE75_09295 [bacterium]|nr:hypothetical protein [bacterium]